jgi:hypothetical protein
VLTQAQTITCPNCGEPVDIVVDLSVPEQQYIEDCFVCCRPMSIRYISDGHELTELDVEGESA